MAEVESFGTTFSTGSTADYTSATFTPLTKIVDLEPPEEAANDIKTSHLASTSKRHTYQAGYVEPGECKLKLIWTAAVHSTMKGYIGVDKAFKITYSDNSIQPFNGYVKSVGAKVQMDDIVYFEVTVKVSGVSGFTAGS